MIPSPASVPDPHPGPTPRNRRRPRRGLPYLLGTLLVALLIAGFLPRSTPVEVAKATTGSLQTTVNEEGRTRIRHRFLVSAPSAGQLRRIPLKPGAEVAADQTILAIIDPIPPALLDARSRSLAGARRDSASAQLDKAREARRFAALDLARFQKLHREGSVSSQELESHQWRETAAAKEVAAAESALRQAEAELAEFSGPLANLDTNLPPILLRAPASGRVLRVLEENARVVAAGTPLLEVGDPTDLEIVIEVLSRDGAAILPGARVLLDQWGGPTPLEAKVRLVEPAGFTKISALGVEEQRVNVVADLVSPPALRPSLGDGFRVEARIVVWEADDVLKVPAGALFRHGRDWAAYLVHDGRAILRPVRTGRTSSTEVQITDGLQPDETVILYPGDRIRARLRVRPIALAP